MKVYQVIADFGAYEDAREYTVGIWEDEDIANYEKELYISNVNHLIKVLEPLVRQEELDYETLSEEEYYKKYPIFLHHDFDLRDLQDFNFCKVKEIEINKRLVDIMEQYKV